MNTVRTDLAARMESVMIIMNGKRYDFVLTSMTVNLDGNAMIGDASSLQTRKRCCKNLIYYRVNPPINPKKISLIKQSPVKPLAASQIAKYTKYYQHWI